MPGPIVALIPKAGATHEGELRPIAFLPYIDRIWMAVRKADVKEWARKLHKGTRKAPEALAWELAVRAEAAAADNKWSVAAYLDCSKCYENVDPGAAHGAAIETWCGPV